MSLISLNKRVKNLREERGWTQQQVARKSSGFLNHWTISNIEIEKHRTITWNHIQGFCHAFDLSPVGLLINVQLDERVKNE